MMRSKIHRATVTNADLNYEGSISIDKKLLQESGILTNEKVDVLNINNGERFTTYVIPGGDGQIQINGAAARKVCVGDKVIIIAYASMGHEEAKNLKSIVTLVNEENKPIHN